MQAIMDKFLELWRESTITSSILAIGVLVLVAYCVVNRTPIPDVLTNGFLIIVTFFFYDKASELSLKRLSARSAIDRQGGQGD